MSFDVRLPELRRLWEEAHQRGVELSAEQLCQPFPELLDQVRSLIELWRMDTSRPQPSWSVPFEEPGPPPPSAPAAVSLHPVTLQVGAEPIPGYHLVQYLGRGSSGQVWKATGPGSVPVALKFIDLHGAAVEARALELMKQLRHPHLLTLVGYWRTAQLLIVALELADGTLTDRLQHCRAQRLPGIPRGELLEYMVEAAKGIDYLNDPRHGVDGKQSVQHRDIKPANLLLVGGSVKVGDFGLAKLIEQTRAGNTMAFTVAYAAPEFFDSRVAHTSDQYSLAVSYCELRGGRLPFPGSIQQQTLGHITQPPDLSMLPEEEWPVVARALAKQPEQRWPSCRAFVQALTASAADPPAAASVPTRRPLPSPFPVTFVEPILSGSSDRQQPARKARAPSEMKAWKYHLVEVTALLLALAVLVLTALVILLPFLDP
jgi:serine/threonine-protein kinase